MMDAVFEAAPVGLAHFVDGRLVRANAAFGEVLGVDPGGLVGQTVTEVFQPFGTSQAEELLDGSHARPLGLTVASVDGGRLARVRAARTPEGVVVSLERLPDPAEVGRYARDAQLLFELGRTVGNQTDLTRVLQRVADTALVLAGAEAALVLLPSELGEAAGLTVRARGGVELATGVDEAVLAAGDRVLRQRTLSAFALVEHGLSLQVAVVPIVAAGRPMGALAAVRVRADGDPEAFEPARLQRLRTAADFAALGADMAARFAEHQRRVRELVLLNEVASECADLGLDRLMPAVTQRICRALNATLCGLLFLDRQQLVTGAVSTAQGMVPGARAAPPGKGGLCERALELRQMRRGPVDRLGMPELEGVFAERGLREVVVVPLIAKDRAIGVVVVGRELRPLSGDEAPLLGAICGEVAVAIENARLFQETQRRASDLEAVRTMGLALARSLDSKVLLEQASAKLLGMVEVDAVRIYLNQNGSPRSVVASGVSDEFLELVDALPFDDEGARAMWATTDAVEVDLSVVPAPARELIKGAGLRRLAVAPIQAGLDGADGAAELSGLVYVGRRTARPFAASELQLLRTLVGQLAMALQNAHLYEQMQVRVEDLAIVAEAGRALVGAAPLEKALDEVAGRLARLVGVRHCLILLLEKGGKVLRGAGASEGLRGDVRTMRLGVDERALSSKVVREDSVQIAVDAAGLADASPEFVARHGLRSLFGLPLRANGGIVGVMILGDTGRRPAMSPPEIDRAMAIGNQVASAIERARLNAELEHSLEELSAAQHQLVKRERLAALGELAALVAHEVRNPLGVIFSSLGSLATLVKLEGDAQRLFGLMRDEAGRLNRIVGEMLDYTRPIDARIHEVSLPLLLETAVASASASEASRGTSFARVSTTVEPTVGLPAVPLDEELVHQALVNLLSNAYQSLRGAGHVRVSASVEGTAGRRRVQVRVADDGPGVSPEVAGRLFEPFVTTKAKGSGLGLAVVRRIVEAHRGEVRVEAPPGGGTAFVLEFPLDPISPVSDPLQVLPRPGATP